MREALKPGGKSLDIDALEWVGPQADMLLGLHKKATNGHLLFPFYHYPGWHSPSNVEALFMPIKEWDCLSPYLQTIIEDAAAYAHLYITTKFTLENIEHLKKLRDIEKDKELNIVYLPPKVLYPLWQVTKNVLDEQSKDYGQNVYADRPERHFHLLYESYKNFMDSYKAWNMIADDAYVSSLHHGHIAPYYQILLDSALGGT